MKSEQANFDEVAMNDKYLKKDVINDKTVKNMQFAKPYFQFSAACAGCAETTYIKLLSQMVGDRMYAGQRRRLLLRHFRRRAPSCPTARTARAAAPPGSTPCLRTTPSSLMASSTLRMPSARSC